MTLDELADEWNERLVTAARAQYKTAESRRRVSQAIEAIVIVLTVAAAATAYASFPAVLVGSLSVAAGVAALIDYSALSGGPAHQHRAAGVAYFSIRRQLDLLRSSEVTADGMRAVAARYDDVSQAAPLPAQRIYRAMREQAKSLSTDEVDAIASRES